MYIYIDLYLCKYLGKGVYREKVLVYWVSGGSLKADRGLCARGAHGKVDRSRWGIGVYDKMDRLLWRIGPYPNLNRGLWS